MKKFVLALAFAAAFAADGITSILSHHHDFITGTVMLAAAIGWGIRAIQYAFAESKGEDDLQRTPIEQRKGKLVRLVRGAPRVSSQIRRIACVCLSRF